MNELKLFAAQIVVVLLLLLFVKNSGLPPRTLAPAPRQALPRPKRKTTR